MYSVHIQYKNFKRHRQERHQPNTSGFKCTEDGCQAKPRSQLELKQHIEVQHTGKRFLCAHCGKHYQSMQALRLHTSFKHDREQQKTFRKCEICHKEFINKIHYQGHVSSHHKIKPEICTQCGAKFTYHQSLTRHKKTCGKEPENSNAYSCAICGKGFTRRQYLMQHIRGKHEGNQYHCNRCGRKFCWKSSQRKHLMSCQANTDVSGQQ